MTLRYFDALDSLMNTAFYEPFHSMENLIPYMSRNRYPNLEMYVETDTQNISVSMELPGLDKKDVNIQLKDNILTVEGERKYETEKKEGETETKGRTYYHREHFYGKFSRSIRLPDDVNEDNITASFSNGILKIDIPKKVANETDSRRIHIN